MGRHGTVASTLPPAAVQSPPAMPPMPPMPHMPPKKRYLMENPPRPGGLIQLAEVSSLPRRPPPGGDLTNYQHQLNGYAPPPNGLNGLNGLNGARHRVEYETCEPLNLTTPSNHEVQLSRIVDKVVEKMLKTDEMDDGRQGDPLRLWFSNQFETKQRNECSSSSSTPSPRHKSASPQLPSPAAAGSPGRPSPGLVPPGTDTGPETGPESRSADTGAEQRPQPADGADTEPDTGVMELTIGMSDTINRVIDNVYRRDRRSAEVTSCSSDCVGSTTQPEPAPPPPPPPPPPPGKRRSPPAGGGRERARVKRASPGAGAGATPAKRNRAAAATVTATSIANAAALASAAAPAVTSAAVTSAAAAAAAVTAVTTAAPVQSPTAADRLSAAASDEEDAGGHSLVIDESPGVGVGVGVNHSPDSRSERSPPVIAPGSPRRRNRKRNPPADIRIGDAKLADTVAAPNRGSRKRKVGKEDIVRIQKDGDSGLDGSSPPLLAKDKSKSQPK